jgi:hypothetical protein
MRHWLCSLGCALALWITISPIQAEEANPSKDYNITPEAGPWVICATCYTGEEAASLAHQTVLQLRSRDNLRAYVHNFSAQLRQQQQEYTQELTRDMPGVPKRTIRVEDQYGVLIGGFKDIDSARAALEKVKQLQPPTPVLKNGQVYERNLYLHEKDKPDGKMYTGKLNPFANSFVARNPTVPHEKPNQEAFDPFWKQLNADESYSLLENKHLWTLVIKQYQGLNVVAPKEEGSSLLQKLGLGDDSGKLINAAGMNAHNMAEALRKMKFEAYVLHTRNSSLVTIGGYDAPDDPKLLQMQQTIMSHSKHSANPGDPNAQMELFVQPMPMKVPRP